MQLLAPKVAGFVPVVDRVFFTGYDVGDGLNVLQGAVGVWILSTVDDQFFDPSQAAIFGSVVGSGSNVFGQQIAHQFTDERFGDVPYTTGTMSSESGPNRVGFRGQPGHQLNIYALALFDFADWVITFEISGHYERATPTFKTQHKFEGSPSATADYRMMTIHGDNVCIHGQWTAPDDLAIIETGLWEDVGLPMLGGAGSGVELHQLYVSGWDAQTLDGTPATVLAPMLSDEFEIIVFESGVGNIGNGFVFSPPIRVYSEVEEQDDSEISLFLNNTVGVQNGGPGITQVNPPDPNDTIIYNLTGRIWTSGSGYTPKRRVSEIVIP
jgi:hypothetical protein